VENHLSQSAGQRAAALAVLGLSGICLRLTVLAIPPVVPLLHAELQLSETEIGWLSSLPPLLFAIAAVPGAILIARFGVVPALVVGLLLNAVGSAARAALPDVVSLYAATIVMAAGVAIMQPTLPPLVRAWFPSQIGFATALYTNGLLVGEILAAALTIPIILPLTGNSWRLSFVIWSVPVAVTALLVALFAPATRDARTVIPANGRHWWPDWKNPLTWQLGLILGGVNAIYFVANAFLPDYVIAAGRPDLVGSALTALNVGQLPAGFLMLGFAGRLVTRPWAYVATGAASLLCLFGLMASTGPWIVFWSGVLGFTNAVTLILALALPAALSAPDDVHRASAGMFTVSYSLAMVSSIVGGWLWDRTHISIMGFAPLALSGLLIIALAPTVSRKPAMQA
jgi:MFS transporter, CP family, cyanate transporter